MTEQERLAGDGEQRSRVRRAADVLRLAYGRPALPRSEPPIDGLIRTVLSQHTSGLNCGRAFASLRSHFRTWDAVERAPVRDIAAAIRSAGLSRTKAPRIRGILREIRARYGRLTLAPLRRMDDAAAMEALRTLSGVGPKTAACVLLFSLGRDVFPVDTHVHRICRRLGFVSDAASAERAQALMALRIPPGRALEFHINLIRHGRRICRAKRPNCGECVLAAGCPSEIR